MYFFDNTNIYVEGKFVRSSISFDERISSFSPKGKHFPLPDDALVLPGFIDTHVHGAGGADAMDADLSALSTIAGALAKEGTTSFLATTMTQSKSALISALSAVKQYMQMGKSDGADIVGVHMEGPFISKKYKGAQNEEYICPPQKELFDELNAASGNNIKVVTMAPEIDGAVPLIEYLSRKGICVSIGHSNATYADMQRAVAAGARYITHTYNAQSPLFHREIGVVGSALLMDELSVEVIADMLHVSPPAIKLLLKNKDTASVVLVTDSIRAKGLDSGESELGGQRVIVKGDEARLADGTLAGSVLSMNKAIKNMITVVGEKAENVIKMATINPAKKLGLDKEIGSIELGKRANFAIVDHEYNVLYTFKNGKLIYSI